MEYNFYCDGAASMRKDGNGNYIREAGGWGFVLVDKENNKAIYQNSGRKDSTTNQEMELTAIHEVFRYYVENLYDEERCDTINIYSDSAYCVNMLQDNGWVYTWRKNDWRRKGNKPIENLELIQKIYITMFSLNEGFRKVNFIKVRGHSGDMWNEYADRLAVNAKEDKIQGNRIKHLIVDEFQPIKNIDEIVKPLIVESDVANCPKIWTGRTTD